jgi:hypothetical protein
VSFLKREQLCVLLINSKVGILQNNETELMQRNLKYFKTKSSNLSSAVLVSEDDLSALVVTGIIVGCVLGGSAVIAGVSFGVYKYVNRGSDHVPSRDSSRRSSASSSDGGITNRSYMKSKVPRRLPPIKEFYTSSITKR